MIRLHEAARKRKAAPPPVPAALNQPTIARILQKYGIVDENGQWTMTLLAKNEETGTKTPLLNPDVVESFAAADPTREKSFLDWMLLQAGGGEAARKQSREALATTQKSKLEELTDPAGWEDSKGKKHPPLSPEQAEKECQERYFPEFSKTLLTVDEDLKSGDYSELFGYYQEWPGPNNLYERVRQAIKDYLGHTSKENGSARVSVLNQGRERRAVADAEKELVARRLHQTAYDELTEVGQEEVNAALRTMPPEEREAAREMAKGKWDALDSTFSKYTTLADLEAFNSTVRVHFKRREAEKDVRWVGRHATEPEQLQHHGREVAAYENDGFKVVIPASMMASIESGKKLSWVPERQWCVTTRGQLDTAFNASGSGTPYWTSYSKKSGLFAFLLAKRNLGGEAQQIAIQFKPGDTKETAKYTTRLNDGDSTFAYMRNLCFIVGVGTAFEDAAEHAANLVAKASRNKMIKVDPTETLRLARRLASELLG